MLIAVAMAATLAAACEKPAAVAPPPPEVYVTPVVQQDVPVYLDLVGQTQGFQDVDIRARVEGFLNTVNFREGSFVRKGDLLYQIDPKPLQATLAQANAELATARARLAKADNDPAGFYKAKLMTARFFMARLLPQQTTLFQTVGAGKATLVDMPAEAF